MEIRKIKAQTVCDTVKKLFTDCNYFIGKDIMCALETARDNESSACRQKCTFADYRKR